MMKRYTLLAMATAFATGTITAQNLVDAMRFSSVDLNGTARYRSMAGAFGALGGDPTCMSENPAGLGIYRGTSVVTFTPSINLTSTETSGFGVDKKKKSDNNFSVGNFSGVFSFKPEDSDYLVNFNLGVGFERRQENFRKYTTQLNSPSSSLGNYLHEQANNYLHDYHCMASVLGTDGAWSSHAPLLTLMAYETYAIDDDPDDPYSVINPVAGLNANQAMRVDERNRQDEYNIAASVNFNDVLYLGATFKITDFNSTIDTEFDELYPQSTSDALYYDNTLETKGSGIGMNMGLLWKVTDSWRIGAAVHTPTWLEMKEYYYAYIETKFLNSYNKQDGAWCDYNDSWEYEFQTPWEYQLSTAYIIGSRALVSLEWDMRDFTTMKYSLSNNYVGNSQYFKEINEAIKDRAQMQHTLKVGAEYRINQGLSARLGYAYVTSPYEKKAMLSEVDSYDQYLLYSSSNKLNYSTLDDQQYITAGLGWRGKRWSFDFAWVNHFTKEYVAAYPADYADSNIFDMKTYRSNFDLSFSYRF